MAEAARKPHLLKAKQQIVALLDAEIDNMKSAKADNREIAIWIRQRNRIAKDAGLALLEAGAKTHNGVIVFEG